VRTRCGLLKCVAQHGVHEMFALVGAKCTPGGTCSDLDGGLLWTFSSTLPPKEFQDEPGGTEMRYNLT
jgi:hypothetical protein